MTVTDTWADWTTDASTDTPPGTATPEIDDELRNIKAQVKANVVPGKYAADATGLYALVTAIGSDDAEIIIDSTITINPTASTYTIPANITVKAIKPGAFAVANNKTLIINGPIEAGPYQIFSWTGSGAIDISGSPTKDCPLEWWGGVAAKTTDNSAALIKAAASVGADQTICLASGEYGLLTATVIGDSSTANNTTFGFHIRGMGLALTRLYINTPGEDGLTLGAVTANSSIGNNNLSLEGFSVVGPTTCCTNGIKIIKWHDARIDLNFFLGGASAYALDMQGCIWAKVNVSSGRTYDNWTYYWPNPGWPSASYPNAFHFESTSDNWGFNVGELNVEVKQQYHNIGVLMDGTQGGSATHLTGSIEDCMEPLDITNWADVVVDVHYMIDNNQSGPTITNCQRVTLNNVLAQYGAITTSIINSRMTAINNCQLAVLSIDANCIGTTINNLATTSITDLAPDTFYEGSIQVGGNSTPFQPLPAKISDRRNLLTNFYLNRWTATYPDGWADPTPASFAQCGTGIVDTTKHLVDYSGLITTSGAPAVTAYYLSAAQLEAILGRVINFTIWAYAPNSPTQNFGTGHIGYTGINITVPTWANTTAYKVGQAVIPSPANAYMYVCILAGTSGGSQPTWPTTAGNTVAEGTGKPTWKCYATTGSNGYQSYIVTPFKQAQIATWTKLVNGGYIPTNATAINISVTQNQQTGAVDSKCYWAEPCLMVGWQGPDSLVQGQDEHQKILFVNGSAIIADTLIPSNSSSIYYSGYYFKPGDMCLNKSAASGSAPGGWTCTTAGSPGTWKAWANLP